MASGQHRHRGHRRVTRPTAPGTVFVRQPATPRCLARRSCRGGLGQPRSRLIPPRSPGPGRITPGDLSTPERPSGSRRGASVQALPTLGSADQRHRAGASIRAPRAAIRRFAGCGAPWEGQDQPDASGAQLGPGTWSDISVAPPGYSRFRSGASRAARRPRRRTLRRRRPAATSKLPVRYRRFDLPRTRLRDQPEPG